MTSAEKLLVIGLDGYSAEYADRLMARGALPSLARIKQNSARFQLEHGAARRTGLAFEHFSSGLSPEACDRWSAIHFDKDSYRAWQEDGRFPPFTRLLAKKTLVFDTPYFDLGQDPRVQGVVSWGAHDPGTPLAGRPCGLLDEIMSRFGPYPAPEWIYGFAWPSEQKCRAMGQKLCEALDKRAKIIHWLFRERVTDWDVGITVISEPHSASEALWHGVDPSHPLHDLPSAEAAAASMEAVYRSVDKLVGELQAAFPAATLLLFSMHGMGANESDVSSMALLPELLLRKYTGKSMLRPRPEWSASPSGVPMLPEDQSWRIPMINETFSRRIRSAVINAGKPFVRHLMQTRSFALPTFASSSRLDWMPAIHYQPHWAGMPAFALPSFYDGRIRVNLRDRERDGIINPEDHTAFCRALGEELASCLNPRTARPAVRSIEFSCKPDPLELDASEADIVVVWDGAALALEHPGLGTIGPLPYRRSGGHTGGPGVAYISGLSIAAGDHGNRSAFDVVPTIFTLAGAQVPPHLSGSALLEPVSRNG